MTSSIRHASARVCARFEQPVEYQPDGEPVVQSWGRALALHSRRRLLGRLSILNDRPDLLRKGKQREEPFSTGFSR